MTAAWKKRIAAWEAWGAAANSADQAAIIGSADYASLDAARDAAWDAWVAAVHATEAEESTP